MSTCSVCTVCVHIHLSMARRAPMTEIIPLGQTSTSSKLPRQGCVTVTVTATCSNVSSTDCFRSEADTEEQREQSG